MKIVQLSRRYRGSHPQGVYVAELSQHLNLRGHEVTVIHSDKQSIVTQKDGISEHFIERVTKFHHPAPERKIKQVRGILDKIQPDLIHLHGNENFPLEEDLAKDYALLKTLHDYEFCPTSNKFHRIGNKICTHPTGKACLFDMLFKRCTPSWKGSERKIFYKRALEQIENDKKFAVIIVHTDYLKQEAVASGYSSEQLKVIPFYVNEPTEFIGLSKKRNQILFFGGFHREKGLEHLIRVLETLPRRPRWFLKIAGAGHKVDKIKKLARRLKVHQRLTFAGGLEPLEIAKLFQESLMVVIPSLGPEHYGEVALKALSYKKPLIAYKVGAMEEWVKDGESGFLVARGDSKGFAKKIDYVINHADEVKEMTKAGKLDAAARFSVDAHIEKVLATYEEVRHLGKKENGSDPQQAEG